MPALIAAVSAWLKSKLGTFLGSAVLYLLKRAALAVWNWIADRLYWAKRKIKQDEALKKVEEAVQSGAPRTDESKNREEDWLNS